MVKKEDTTAINNLILELAKANNWQSKKDLKEKTGKPIKTIREYLNNSISNLIETEDFIEERKRRTGKANTLIKKYRLKKGLTNLLAVFNQLNDKKYQREILRTAYFMSLTPDIETKVKDITKQQVINNVLKSMLKLTICNSPSAIEFLLRLNDEVLEQTDSKLLKPIKKAIPRSVFLRDALKYLYWVDILSGNITTQEVIESQNMVVTKSQT